MSFKVTEHRKTSMSFKVTEHRTIPDFFVHNKKRKTKCTSKEQNVLDSRITCSQRKPLSGNTTLCNYDYEDSRILIDPSHILCHSVGENNKLISCDLDFADAEKGREIEKVISCLEVSHACSTVGTSSFDEQNILEFQDLPCCKSCDTRTNFVFTDTSVKVNRNLVNDNQGNSLKCDILKSILKNGSPAFPFTDGQERKSNEISFNNMDFFDLSLKKIINFQGERNEANYEINSMESAQPVCDKNQIDTSLAKPNAHVYQTEYVPSCLSVVHHPTSTVVAVTDKENQLTENLAKNNRTMPSEHWTVQLKRKSFEFEDSVVCQGHVKRRKIDPIKLVKNRCRSVPSKKSVEAGKNDSCVEISPSEPITKTSSSYSKQDNSECRNEKCIDTSLIPMSLAKGAEKEAANQSNRKISEEICAKCPKKMSEEICASDQNSASSKSQEDDPSEEVEKSSNICIKNTGKATQHNLKDFLNISSNFISVKNHNEHISQDTFDNLREERNEDKCEFPSPKCKKKALNENMIKPFVHRSMATSNCNNSCNENVMKSSKVLVPEHSALKKKKRSTSETKLFCQDVENGSEKISGNPWKKVVNGSNQGESLITLKDSDKTQCFSIDARFAANPEYEYDDEICVYDEEYEFYIVYSKSSDGLICMTVLESSCELQSCNDIASKKQFSSDEESLPSTNVQSETEEVSDNLCDVASDSCKSGLAITSVYSISDCPSNDKDESNLRSDETSSIVNTEHELDTFAEQNFLNFSNNVDVQLGDPEKINAIKCHSNSQSLETEPTVKEPNASGVVNEANTSEASKKFLFTSSIPTDSLRNNKAFIPMNDPRNQGNAPIIDYNLNSNCGNEVNDVDFHSGNNINATRLCLSKTLVDPKTTIGKESSSTVMIPANSNMLSESSYKKTSVSQDLESVINDNQSFNFVNETEDKELCMSRLSFGINKKLVSKESLPTIMMPAGTVPLNESSFNKNFLNQGTGSITVDNQSLIFGNETKDEKAYASRVEDDPSAIHVTNWSIHSTVTSSSTVLLNESHSLCQVKMSLLKNREDQDSIHPKHETFATSSSPANTVFPGLKDVKSKGSNQMPSKKIESEEVEFVKEILVKPDVKSKGSNQMPSKKIESEEVEIIKEILVKPNKSLQSISDHSILTGNIQNSRGNFKCLEPSCICCRYMETKREFIFYVTRVLSDINSHITCKTINVIFIVDCASCEKQYFCFSEESTLEQCLKRILEDISNKQHGENEEDCVKHFKQEGHKGELKIYGIDANIRSKEELEKRRNFWLSFLYPVQID